MGKEQKILVMENNFFVTIAIPLYNKEQYIERCFNSVAKQTYKNIECIIVEDCSTDNSMRIAEQLIANYIGPIKFLLIKHEQNEGLSVSRNTGIFNSKGDYIFFLDADDEITENCISSLVALAEKYPGVDMVQGGIIQRPFKTESWNIKGKLKEYVKDNNNIKKYYNSIPVFSWNKLTRKEFIIQNNLYFKKGLVHEDFHWKYFWIKYIVSFAFTAENTYIYYTYIPNSIMSNNNLSSSISTYLTIVEDMLLNLDFDILERQILYIHDLLKQQKNKILYDELYSSFIPRYKVLYRKINSRRFFLIRELIIRKIKYFILKLLNYTKVS